MLLAARPAIAPLNPGRAGAPFLSAAMNITSGPLASSGMSVMQFTALEPIRSVVQFVRGTTNNSAAAPPQSRSSGSGNNFAHQPSAMMGPVHRKSAPRVTTTSGTTTTNLKTKRTVCRAASISSRNPILVKKRIATRAVAGGNAIRSTILGFLPTYLSAARARMRSSVVIAKYPAARATFRSLNNATQSTTSSAFSSMLHARGAIVAISRLAGERTQRFLIEFALPTPFDPGLQGQRSRSSQHQRHQAGKIEQQYLIADRSEFDSGFGDFRKFHREEPVRKMHRDQRGQENDRHRDTHPGNQYTCQDGCPSDEFGQRRRPCSQQRLRDAKRMQDDCELLRASRELGIAVRHEAVADRKADRQRCPVSKPIGGLAGR